MESWKKEATFGETRNILEKGVKVILIEEIDTKKLKNGRNNVFSLTLAW